MYKTEHLALFFVCNEFNNGLIELWTQKADWKSGFQCTSPRRLYYFGLSISQVFTLALHKLGVHDWLRSNHAVRPYLRTDPLAEIGQSADAASPCPSLAQQPIQLRLQCVPAEASQSLFLGCALMAAATFAPLAAGKLAERVEISCGQETLRGTAAVSLVAPRVMTSLLHM